jgi:ketosteroid isomerase-like protein
MSADANIKTIEQVYAAFGSGDVETILDALTEDIDWAADVATPVAPWHGERHGKGAVTDFFATFGQTMDVHDFTPISIAANDTDVLTVVRHSATARTTGKTITMNLHHYFRFRDGKIAYYRGSEDSAQVAWALQP